MTSRFLAALFHTTVLAGVVFGGASATPARPVAPPVKKAKVPLKISLARYPIRGTAIHFCSCNAPCQCMFRDGDMEGCNLAAIYRFRDGGYADRLYHTRLAGVTVAVVHRPQPLIDGKTGLLRNGLPVDEVVYIPEGSTPAQEAAAQFALTEHAEPLASGALLVRRKPISFRQVKGGYEVEIPGVLRARTEPMLGEGNRQMVVDHVPFNEGERWLLGLARVHTYQDPDEAAWKWSYPDSNGAWTHFSWTIVNRD